MKINIKKYKKIVHFHLLGVFVFCILLNSSHVYAFTTNSEPFNTTPLSNRYNSAPSITTYGLKSIKGPANNHPIAVGGLFVSGASSSPVYIRLGVSSGSLSMFTTTGLTFTTSNSASVLIFSGLIEDINRDLNNLTYQTEVVGDATLTATLETSADINPSVVSANPHLRSNITVIKISASDITPLTSGMTISTDTASNIDNKSARPNGYISGTGSPVTDRGFQWGTDTNYGNTVSDPTAKNPIFERKTALVHDSNGMVVDSNGQLFVSVGSGYDTIDVYDKDGNYLRHFGSHGSGDGQLNYPFALAVDDSNNIYVADKDNGRIEKFDNAGNYLAQFDAGLNLRPYGVAVDHSGNIYEADDNGTINVFNSAGNLIKVIGSNGSGDGQFGCARGVVVDSSGNVYGIDGCGNRIEKFDSSGNYISQFGNGNLDSPISIAIDSSNNLYVTNYNIQYLVKFDSNGNFLNSTNIDRGIGTAVDSSDNLYYTDGYLIKSENTPSYPTGPYGVDISDLSCNTTYHYRAFGVNSSGTAYGDDQSFTTGICSVVNTNPATKTTSSSSTLNGSVTSSYSEITNLGYNIGKSISYDKIINSIANSSITDNYAFSFGPSGSNSGNIGRDPEGLTTDSEGNIYIADQNNNRIDKFDSSGNFLLQWTDPGFSYVYALATDKSNNVYVSDWGNCDSTNVKVFDSNGNFLRQFGLQGNGDGQFACDTSGITIDSLGNVYVIDWYNNRIEKFDSSGNYISQFGSTGSGDGQLNGPWAITHDNLNNIYVVDGYNDRIEKFDSSGNYISQFANGLNLARYSYGIASDSHNNIYINGNIDYPIYIFDSVSGSITGTAGTYGNNNQDGGIWFAEGMAMDSKDNLYISNYNADGNLIYKFTPRTLFGLGSFSSDVSSLQCGTNYHFQAFMTNQESTYNGSDQSFTTNACPPSGVEVFPNSPSKQDSPPQSTLLANLSSSGPTENNIINSTPSHTNKTPNKSPKVGNASIGKYLPYISLFGILGFLIIIRIKSRYKKI